MSDSFITKNAIAAGLKECTRKKRIDKITISDIMKECGMNRQTFYYHFQDKFELIDWIYQNEAIAVIKDGITYTNWSDKVEQMLQKMKSEFWFYESTLANFSDTNFRDYVFRITSGVFREVIEEIAGPEEEFKKEEKFQKQISQEEKEFIADFYAFGIVGVIMSWAQSGMKESPEVLAQRLKGLVLETKKYMIRRK